MFESWCWFFKQYSLLKKRRRNQFAAIARFRSVKWLFSDLVRLLFLVKLCKLCLYDTNSWQSNRPLFTGCSVISSLSSWIPQKSIPNKNLRTTSEMYNHIKRLTGYLSLLHIPDNWAKSICWGRVAFSAFWLNLFVSSSQISSLQKTSLEFTPPNSEEPKKCWCVLGQTCRGMHKENIFAFHSEMIRDDYPPGPTGVVLLAFTDFAFYH